MAGDSEILVLYGGNLGEKQGLEIILESAHLTRERPAIRYILAGDGAARPRLLAKTRHVGLDNIIYIDIQSEERFPLLLAAGDIHMVIQRREAGDLVMPSKLTNIMAAWRPFIATALPGTELARIAADSQGGILVPPGEGRALAQAILKLAGEENTRKEMGFRARRYAEAKLSREEILSRVEDLLYLLTSHSHARRFTPARV